MTTEKQSFEKAMHLFNLIQQNVQLVAEEVVSKHPHDSQYIDSAKLGAMECWTDRLCGLLSETDVQYLTDLLEKKLADVKERE